MRGHHACGCQAYQGKRRRARFFGERGPRAPPPGLKSLVDPHHDVSGASCPRFHPPRRCAGGRGLGAISALAAVRRGPGERRRRPGGAQLPRSRRPFLPEQRRHCHVGVWDGVRWGVWVRVGRRGALHARPELHDGAAGGHVSGCRMVVDLFLCPRASADPGQRARAGDQPAPVRAHGRGRMRGRP